MKSFLPTLALTICCSLRLLAQEQTQSMQLRLERALEDARSISNIEIQVEHVLWIKGRAREIKPFDEDYWLTNRLTYIASGVRYRTELHSSGTSTNIAKARESAFDGKLYAEFGSGSHTMVQQDEDMLGDSVNPLTPLVGPFLFLSKETEFPFVGRLRFTDLFSADALNGIILPEQTNSNGQMEISFTGLPCGETNVKWKLMFDPSCPGFRPTKIREVRPFPSKTNEIPIEEIYTLSDYTNLGAFYFPMRMDSVVTVSLPGISGPYASNLTRILSIKTPAEIPDTMFRLDESQAGFIWNTRENKDSGVGIILGAEGSNVVVKRIMADSPAGRQQEIKAGDRVVMIGEGTSNSGVTASMSGIARARGLLQGKKETTVRVTFVRAGEDDSKTHVISLIRGKSRDRFGDGRLIKNGAKAPDIEVITLDTGAKEKLKDYAGKFVVLEFWATWCGPCQKSMADLQEVMTKHPAWQDKVVIISASIDDSAEIASKRVKEKGWDKTHNVWMPADAIRACHVGPIPGGYVIDPHGSVLDSGVMDGATRVDIDQVLAKGLLSEK